MTWEMVALGEVAELERNGVEPHSLAPSTRYLGLEHIERGGRILGTSTVGSAEIASTKFKFTPEHVLFGKLRPNLGKVSRPSFSGVCSTDIIPIRPGARIDRGFLAHYLSQPRMIGYAAARATGANLPRLSPTSLAAIPVPVPSVEEQRRIAAILDQADELRAKRREQLSRFDKLGPALFRDTFGDPLAVDASVSRAQIGELAVVRTGNSPSRSEDANFGDGIEWIKSDNLGGEIATEATERLSDAGRSQARIAPPGSILVTCIAGSATSIGKASKVDREVAFNQQINAILPSEELDSDFLLVQLKTAPELVRSRSTSGMKGLVSKSAFSSIEVLVPPIREQRAFATHLASLATVRSTVGRALAADDELFASLQARAFRGEL